MKKITRAVAVTVLSVLMLFLFTSCSKTPSDTAGFEKLAEKKGYKVIDVTDHYLNAPQIKEGTVAAPSDRSFQIEFYIITDMDSAKELFKAQSKEIDGIKGTTWSGNISNGRNYAKSTVISDGKYTILCYIDNTLLYVPPTDKANKETIDAFVDALKY